MGLITKTVKIKPAGKLSSHLKNKGYCFLNKNEEVEIDVNDLPPKSNTVVELLCDDCNIVFTLRWINYVSGQMNKYNGKTYCSRCIVKGERNYLWNSNITQEEREQKRNYQEYHDFIKRVLARDHYTCQRCGIHSNDLDVHHMDGYNWCISKRTDDTNGIALCQDCHKTFHSLYGSKNNTKEQFEQWMNKEISFNPYTGDIYILPRIYCIDDGIIYRDRNETASIIGCKPMSVHDVCKGRSPYLYGKRYVFYDDYLNGTVIIHPPKMKAPKKDSSVIQTVQHFKPRKKNKKEIVCITTGEKFNLAYNPFPYNIKYSGDIYRVCNNRRKSCGTILLNNNIIPLRWMWFTDFQSLPSHEQLQIALDNKETLQEGSFLYELLYCNDKKDLLSPTIPLNSITA